jgi:cytidylate kinase
MHKIITVDGSSGVGKGTLAVFLSNYLNWSFLDSGAIYRMAALFIHLNKLDLDKPETMVKLSNLPIEFKIDSNGIKYILDSNDVSLAIRTEKCGMYASHIASLSGIREALLSRQKSFDEGLGLIADGRDMGTVVFPGACLKFYLTATSESKAQRRYDELCSKGNLVSYIDVLKNIKQRDAQDTNRKISPLTPALDAVIIDTSNLSISQVQELSIIKLKKLSFTS